MIPFRFSYLAPESPQEAVECMAQEPLASRLVGGGTWVVPELNRGNASVRRVVDLRRAGLGRISTHAGTVAIGATCTYADLLLSSTVVRELPLLVRMAQGITGGRQILNQGTLGGSVAAARPQSDAPAVAVALGAVAIIHGSAGERRVPAGELFVGATTTCIEPGEVLARLEFPPSPGAGFGYFKLKSGASSWPIATAAALVELDARGQCSAARLTLGAVAATPTAVDLSDALVGRVPDEAAIRDARDAAHHAVSDPWADALAPARYRAAVAPVVAVRALQLAVERAQRAFHAERSP